MFKTLVCENKFCMRNIYTKDPVIYVNRKLVHAAQTCTHIAIVCSWECLQKVIDDFIKERDEPHLKRTTDLTTNTYDVSTGLDRRESASRDRSKETS